MGARQKLNRAYFNGSLLLAGVAGWMSESWTLFLIVLMILLIANCLCEEIRPSRKK